MADDTITGAAPADLSNWREAPHSQWAFHNVDRVVPTAAIANAPDNVAALTSAPMSLGGFSLPLPDGSKLDLAGFLKISATDAMVVLKDGKLVYETYANGTAIHTPHIIMSATKSVLGLMVGILQARGDLDVERLVSDYVPEVAETAYRGATLRHLIDMRTGVRLDDAQQRAYEIASNWEPRPPGEAGLGLHDFLASLPPTETPHGGPFAYISANADLMGWAIERATGASFASLVSDLLWKPIGAESAAYITVDGQGAPRCTGGLCATARDIARIGQLVLDDGVRDGRTILPKPWLDDIATGGDPAAWRDGEWGRAFSFISPNMRYRAGWYGVDDDPKHIFAMGVHGQNLFVDKTCGLVVAKLSSQASRIDYRALPLTHQAFPEIRRCLTGAPA